ncbi:autotransporter adhesin family protein [Mesorhizobium australicum]|uniref:calcium-binding protein n=1 Tax=Mesorhizobium australicum TaxID=536018 RepID=UPI003335EA61
MFDDNKYGPVEYDNFITGSIKPSITKYATTSYAYTYAYSAVASTPTSGNSGGGSDHAASRGSPFGNGGLISTPVGDHAGHPNGVSGSKDNGWDGHPVLLDLSGNGLSVNPLSSSSQFIDLDGDGYQHRTAWAGAGNGVLVLDADGDGKISRSSEFVFTEWDQTATSDLEALKSVFDTNHNGELDAGDDRWSEFKVMVDGQLVSLASLGIASIDLTATGSGQQFTDGSAITGTTTYTKTDGTTGAVGDAVLASDANGYLIRSAVVTNDDGSKTATLGGYGKDGTLAFQNRITVSADGLSTTTQFDDDGNGIYDRSQTDVTTIASGMRQRAVSNFDTDGSLVNRSRTLTDIQDPSAWITTTLDTDGDGIADQTQILVRNADGSTTTTVSEFSLTGALVRKVVTTASAEGLKKTVQSDLTGSGTYDVNRTENTDVAGDGTRTKTVTETSSDGTLIGKERTVASADGRTRTVSNDRDGNGTYETREVTVIANGDNGGSVTTVSTYSSTDVLIGKTVATTSANGLVKTVSTDLDGDGLFDTVSSDVTVAGADGGLTETRELKSRDGSLLSSSITKTSADRKTISTSTDADGDGHVDTVKTVTIDGAGKTTSVLTTFNADGSIVSKKVDETSADGLTLLIGNTDLDGDSVPDVFVTDQTSDGLSGSRTRSVTTESADWTMTGQTRTTISADGLTETVDEWTDGSGNINRTTVSVTALAADGSRTVTRTAKSHSGAVLSKIEVKTSADHKTVITKIDDNGDGKTDRVEIDVVHADGSHVLTVSDTDAKGVQHARSETVLSADGLTKTVKQDFNGDSAYDLITKTVTAIAPSGNRTTTTSKTSANGVLLSRTIATVSGNGLSIDTQIDADGNGIVESKSSDATVVNADGSTTRTVSALAGTGALIEKTITTTSANGLKSTVKTDLDGNGTIDRTSVSTTTLGADGSKTDIVTVLNANNSQTARHQTITSGDGNTVVATRDVNGNGTIDESSSTVRNTNGSTTTVNRTYAVGVLTSSATKTVSANGLSSTLAADLDGNGTIDQSTTDVVVLKADGSKTETLTDLDATGAVKDKTTVITSGNSLVKTTTWAAVGATTSRSKVDTTLLNADGSTTETVGYKKADGSLESRTVKTVSANKLTTTVTQDVNGDGAVDLSTTAVTAADGSVTTTTTGPDTTANALGTGAYTTAPSTTSKTTTISADGLVSTTLHGATSIDYLPDLPSKRTTETTIGADASTVQTIKEYESTTVTEQTRTTTAGDGLAITKEWDLNGDASYDRKETDVTVLNADGSKVRTINKFEGTTQTSSFIATTNANGLSVTTSLDLFGANPFSQDSADVTTVNADGSTTRAVTNYKAHGSQLSKFITTTPSDGRVVTTQEDIDGVVGIDRVTVDDTRKLADGSVLKTIKRSTPSGTLLDSTIRTTSGDGRLISIARDADGNGTVDQTEVTKKAIDGSVTTVITDFSAAAHKSSTAKISTSADGQLTTTEWDFEANGTVDQTRRKNVNNLGNGITETKTRDGTGPTDAFFNKTTTYTSDDGRSSWTGVAYDASSGGFDNTNSVVTEADGSTIEGMHNDNRDAAHLAPGVIYWKSAIAGNVVTKTSADGLTTNRWYDYDGNGANPVNLENPSVSNYEVAVVSQVQIDGSVAMTITEKNSSGTMIAKGTMTTSADGLTTTLLKDADNNGTYEHRETVVRHIDGSVRKLVTDTNANGALTQTVTTDVGANGKSVHSVTTDGASHRTEDLLVKADGTAVQTAFVGADEEVRSVYTMDKGGKLTSGTIYDPKNTGPWSRVEQVFDAIGKKTLERQLLDDGKRLEVVFDTVSGQQLSDTTFDVANRVTATETYSGGVIAGAVFYDPANANPWSRVEQSYTGGRKTLEKQFMDNSTRFEVVFDAASGRQMSDTTFDTANRVTATEAYSNGVITGAVLYDPANANPWTRVEQSNTGGKKTLENQFMDDGTRIDIIFDAASGKQVQTTTYDGSNRMTAQANYTDGILATNAFYDPANAQTWSTVTQVYNAAAQKTNETVVYDNGTRSQTNLDAANVACWRSGYYEYDAASRLTYEKTVQDDSTSKEIFSDPANTQPWSTVTRNYNAAAQMTNETVVYDNGTHSQTNLDPANVAASRSGYYEYDAANRLTYQKIVSDDGSGSANTYDAAGAVAWSRIDQYFDTADQLYYQNEFNDDGTRTAITLDPSNAQPWTRVVQYLDASGRITFQNNENDGGTSTAYTFDVTNAQAWSSIQNHYNAAHQQILEVDTWDDGTRAELTYDGPTQNVMGIRRFNAAGTITQTLNADQAEAEFAYDALQNFDLAYYLQANPDVAQGWHNGSAKRHFMIYGWKEGRLPKAGYHMPARHTLDLSTTFPTIFKPQTTGGGGGGGGNGDSHGRGPVALDLNGDGLIDLDQLASTADDWAIHFDWAGDGTPQQTSWVGSGDGFLVIDLAADASAGADGVINQAKELQFNLWVGDGATAPVSDLEGLRLAFDSNHDNQFDYQDTRWDEFRVFQDANQNGVSDAGELKSLAEAGIARIGLVSNPEGAVQHNDGSQIVGISWYETVENTRNLVGDIILVSRNDTMVGSTGNDLYRFGIGDDAATIVEPVSSKDSDELDFGAGIDWNELWFAQQDDNLVVSVLGTTDKVTVNDWFAGPSNVVEMVKSGDGKVLHSSEVATLVAAMAGFDPATSPTGSGIQPNDPRLGDPNHSGTIAAAMRSSWMAA